MGHLKKFCVLELFSDTHVGSLAHPRNTVLTALKTFHFELNETDSMDHFDIYRVDRPRQELSESRKKFGISYPYPRWRQNRPKSQQRFSDAESELGHQL